MPGYFTDVRDLSLSGVFETDHEGPGNFNSRIARFPGKQTTTSFRSRMQSDQQLSDDADKIYVNGFKELSSADDNGHEFYTRIEQQHLSHVHGYVASRGSFPSYYRGPLSPGVRGVTKVYPSVSPLSDSEIAFYGQKAIASTAPVAPAANFSDFLAQSVLTKLPKIIGDIGLIESKTQLLRSAGEEYLNLQFGWVPMVSDLRDLLNVVLNSYNMMQQYARDSGRTVRRRFNFPLEETTDIVRGLVGNIESQSNYDSEIFKEGLGNITVYSSFKSRVWFSGAFTYFVPNGRDFFGRMERYASLAQKLLGLKMTPQVLWDLQPWSWLVDWKFDLTSHLAILSDLESDSLVIKYGYLMRRIDASNNYVLTDFTPWVGTHGPYYHSLSVVQKERVRATPFGFAINPADFSAKQLAILGALGLTSIFKR
jgi:hypothetical protein